MLKERFGTVGKALGLFLVLWFIAFPAFSQSMTERAIMEGTRDGENSVSSSLWLIGGCILGFWAIIIGYLVPLTSPQQNYTIGKSPEYVAAYTDSFKDAVKKRQGKQALIGCLIGSGVSAIFLVIYYIAVGAWIWSET